ncbi:MAG: energy transducer TonB [bacterium]|nr:energy transducer TonB [bacterium]
MAIMVDTGKQPSGKSPPRAGMAMEVRVAVAVVLAHLGLMAFMLVSSAPVLTPASATLMVSLLASPQEAPVVSSPSHERARKPATAVVAVPAQAAPALPVAASVPALSAEPLPAAPSSSAAIAAAATADVMPLPAAAAALVVPPNVLAAYASNPKPVYPPVSRRLNESGVSRLHVLVAADGHVQKIEIARSSGFTRLDQAAIAAVRDWTFAPARQGENAVAAWVLVPVNWNLGT